MIIPLPLVPYVIIRQPYSFNFILRFWNSDGNSEIRAVATDQVLHVGTCIYLITFLQAT
jgi:hypothetical protein